MKSISKSFFCAIIFIAFLSAGVKAAVTPKADVVTIQTSAICESCKGRIEKALKGTNGIVSANLNLDNKKIKVKYDPSKISPDQIRTAIANTGYDADDMKANPDAYKGLPACCQKPGAK